MMNFLKNFLSVFILYSFLNLSGVSASNFIYQGNSLTIPTPVFHLDAQDIDGDDILYTTDTIGEPANNATVQTWKDKSAVLAGANNAFQNTASERPQYQLSAINGHPALIFAGTNDNLDISNHSLINQGSNFPKRSIAAVFRTGADIDTIQIIYEEGGGTRGYSFLIADKHIYAGVWNKNEWDVGHKFKSVDLGEVQPNTLYYTFLVQDSTSGSDAGNTLKFYKGGALVSQSSHVDKQISHGANISIGSVQGGTVYAHNNVSPGGSNKDFFQGQIGEIIHWNEVIDQSNIDDLNNYFNEKWGITLRPNVDLNGLEELGADSDVSFAENQSAVNIFATDAYVSDGDSGDFKKIEYVLEGFVDAGSEVISINGENIVVSVNGVTDVASANGLPKMRVTVSDGIAGNAGKKVLQIQALDLSNSVRNMSLTELNSLLRQTSYTHNGSLSGFNPGQRFIEVYVTDEIDLVNDLQLGTINVAFQSLDLNGLNDSGLDHSDLYILGQAGNTPITDVDAFIDTPSSLGQLVLRLRVSGVLNGTNERLYINGTLVNISSNGTSNIAAANGISAITVVRSEGFTNDNGKRILEISKNGAGDLLPSEIQDIVRSLEYDHIGTGGNYTIGQRIFEFIAKTSNNELGSSSKSIISVINTSGNNAPVLDAAGQLTMNTIPVNDTTNAGMIISDIIENGDVTDIDIDPALESIGIIYVDETNGVWQYSQDNGTTWSNIDDGSGVSDSRALLLQQDDKIRFIPTTGYVGMADFGVRAWDETLSSAGTYTNIAGNGGVTAYSSGFEYINIEVRDVLTLANNIPDRLTTNGATQDLVDFDFIFAINTFTPSANLVYTAELSDGNALPSWLSFDPVTRRFQSIGTGPGNSDVGLISIKVTAQDNYGVSANDIFDIEVVNVNDVPTNITLSNNSINENNSVGDFIGNIASVDVDTGDSHTYALVSGSGDEDNAHFTLSGSQMLAGSIFDFESAVDTGDTVGNNTYSVRVKSTDSLGATFEKIFIIAISDVDDTAPVISVTGSNPITIIQGTSYSDAGATYTDNVDAPGTLTGSGTIDTSTVGSYTYSYDITDSAGNIATTATRTILVKGAPILINEVEYDTSGVESASEWFELFNPTSNNITIENWTITEKVGTSSSKTYTFGNITIPAGEFIIVTNDTTEFQNIYSGVTPDIDLPGTAYFQLKNSPDDYLQLKDSAGNDIDYVAWENTSGGWPLSATSSSICRTSMADTDLVGDWSDACQSTPGITNVLNFKPTDISLSSENINENNNVGASVGSLTTTDADSSDTHSYTLIAGSGDSDNASFSLSGSTLITGFIGDYETKQSYNIRIATNDGKGGIYEKTFVIQVNDINLAPTDIAFSGSTITENNSIGDVIATLGASDDGEDTNTLIFSTSCAIPGVDDASVQISGTDIKAASVYDFETQNIYNICVRVTDGVLSYDENFSFTILDLDENPPIVSITAPTKLNNSSITDTTIQITDDVAVNISDISISASGSVTASALNCTQTSSTQVDCSISIDTSGNLVISSLDSSGNTGTGVENTYVIDTVPPGLPNVIVDTSGSFSISSPQVIFSSLDNIAIDHYTITYSLDDGGAGAGILTTINPASSPIVLSLDPDELPVHTIVVTAYDTAGNSATTTIKFPPVVTFTAPTTLSNSTITDSTVTISTPTGNNLTNLVLTPGTTGATLGTCSDAASGTTPPYATPVTCVIHTVANSGTIFLSAEDAGNGAVGSNSQSYIIDTVDPVVNITAPTKIDNTSITDTTITITDDQAIDAGDISIDASSTVTASNLSCTQTNISQVDCTISIDDSGNLILAISDKAGNSISPSENNYIIDTIAPVISLVGSGVIDVEYGSSFTDPGANYTDNVDTSGSLVGAGSVNTGILGAYTLSYDITDTAGNIATQVTLTVNVVDTTAPLISLIGSTPLTLEIGDSYTDLGATWSDLVDGTGSIVAIGGPVTTTATGSFTLSYDIADNAGNIAATVNRIVNVEDTTPPIITLLGIDEITLEIGGTYTESGATANDNLDGDISSNILINSSSVNTSTIGTYFVTYDVIDASGNNAIQLTRKIIVEDTTPAILTLNGGNPITLEIGDSYSDLGAIFTDNVDGTGSIVAGGDTVSTTGTGSFTLTYNHIDSSGNAATQITRTVHVLDTTAPIISLAGNNPETLEAHFTYVDAGASANDNLDGDITGNIISTNTIDNTNLGSYLVNYSVVDASGNTGTGSRVVNVVDTTAPTLTFLGNIMETIEVNTTYTDPGVLCNDNYDASCNIVTSGSVNTSVIGTGSLTYFATDTSGNISSNAVRSYEIVDTTAPIINLVGSGTITLSQGGTFTDPGATCSDNYDSSCNVNPTGSVDVNVVGTYTIQYLASDTNGNSASVVTRTIHIIDSIPPVITLIGSGTITQEVGTAYTDLGANYTDLADGTGSLVGSGSVDISTLGSYTLTYDITDSSGNTATQVVRTIHIVDTTSPVIVLNGQNTVSLYLNQSYTDAGATCTDNYDPSCTVTSSGTVDTTSIGTYIFSYDIADNSGNQAISVSRTIEVIAGGSPIINIIGNSTETLEVGTSYTDPGANYSDLEDGTGSLVGSGSVDISILGNYTLSYDITDSSGNAATQVVRTIQIVDTTSPIITLLGNSSEIVEVNTSYIDAGATASDNYDTNLTSQITVTNPIDITTVGTYTITYNVADSSNNSANQVSRSIIVVNNISDTDGDGVPDLIELQQGSNPNDINDYLDTDGDLNPNYTDTDDDGDSSLDTVESAAPNTGDYNNDGVGDVLQENVATIISPITSGYSSLDISSGGCNSSSFNMIGEPSLATQDSEYQYPVGLANFTIRCSAPGDTVDIKIYLDKEYDRNPWVYKKYNSNTQVYTDISSIVTYSVENIGGNNITVVNYSITDGGQYDEDGIANGIIVDPSGPAIKTGGASGSVKYDRCEGVDTSGSIYDGICGEKIPEETQEEIEDENNENIEEETFVDAIDYTIENNFSSCSIITDINNPDYSYPRSGIFTDENISAYKQGILKFSKIGIVNGYEDGSFGPYKEMTRTEFLKVALKSHCYEYSNEDTSGLIYIDVDKSSWQAKVIKKAESLGMINGDRDEAGNRIFRPNDIISKAEAIKILMRLSMIQAREISSTNYTDITIDWHSKYIENGEALGLFDSNQDDFVFQPNAGVQREYMIDLIQRLVGLYR